MASLHMKLGKSLALNLGAGVPTFREFEAKFKSGFQ
jgi:hypothetical protein